MLTTHIILNGNCKEAIEMYKSAYSGMRLESITISPMQPADYSPCTVRFIDKFDVRWGFWV